MYGPQENQVFSKATRDILYIIAKDLSFNDFKNMRLVNKFFKQSLQGLFKEHIKKFKVKQIAAKSSDNLLILREDGRVLSCGSNEHGCLGLDEIGLPRPLTLISTLEDIKQIVTKNFTTFFIKATGEVYGCGRNDNGQLGIGSDTSCRTPTLIPCGNDVKKIIIGFVGCFFLKQDGTVLATGDNQKGRLGLSDETQTLTLKSVPIDSVKDIIATDYATYFIKNDGTVYVCGLNINGCLGLPPNIKECREPTIIPNLNNVVAIASNGNSAFFLKGDGTVDACGDNLVGQLGLGYISQGTISPNTIPGLNNVIQVFSGCDFTFFLIENGEVWGCGDNKEGILGLPQNILYTSPTLLNHLHNVAKIFLGNSINFFCQENGEIHISKRSMEVINMEHWNKFETSLVWGEKSFKDIICIKKYDRSKVVDDILFLQEDGEVLVHSCIIPFHLKIDPAEVEPTAIPALTKWRVLQKRLEEEEEALKQQSEQNVHPTHLEDTVSANDVDVSYSQDDDEEEVHQTKRQRLG